MIFKPKLFTLIKAGIPKEQIGKDVLAGIVVGIVALPLAIAFAIASGVSPEKGIITAIIAGFIISIFGGSRVQIGGPTGAFIIIVYGIVEKYGLDGLLISTVLAGIILVIFGLLNLGSLLKFFPNPLIVGFTSGIAIVIFSTQIRDALGLQLQTIPSGFIEKWHTYFLNLSTLNYNAILITVITILITIYSKKITTKIPGSFISIIIITLIVSIFKIDVATIGTFFGEISNKINFSIPAINFNNIPYYFGPALTIALLGGIESLLSAVVADGMISGKHRSNTELIAQGIANIVTPFFGGIPATGAIARTATNIKNGGRTPIAGIIHSITLLLILLFLVKWAKLIPMATMAGILIVVAYNMSEWRSFLSILKGSRFDIIVLLTTFFLTILVDLTIAIQVGVVLSALLFMKRMSDIVEKRISDVIDSDIIDDYKDLPKGIGIYEISGPLFFGSAKAYSEVIEQVGVKNKILIIRMRHVSFIDDTGFKNLTSVLKLLNGKEVQVVLSGVQPNILAEMTKKDIFKVIPQNHIFDSFDKAVKYSSEELNH